jgi:hypothetical protein
MSRAAIWTALRWAIFAAAVTAVTGNAITTNLLTGYSVFILVTAVIAATSKGAAPVRKLPPRDALPTILTVVALVAGGHWWSAAALAVGFTLLLGAGMKAEQQAAAYQDQGEEHY